MSPNILSPQQWWLLVSQSGLSVMTDAEDVHQAPVTSRYIYKVAQYIQMTPVASSSLSPLHVSRHGVSRPGVKEASQCHTRANQNPSMIHDIMLSQPIGHHAKVINFLLA